jgi:hypothetical protein
MALFSKNFDDHSNFQTFLFQPRWFFLFFVSQFLRTKRGDLGNPDTIWLDWIIYEVSIFFHFIFSSAREKIFCLRSRSNSN